MRAERSSFFGVLGLVGVLLGLRVVLLGAWWWRVVLVVAVVYVVAAAVRRVRPLAAPFAAVAALALMVVWVFLPTTTVVGVPTGATWSAVGDQLSLAIAVVAEEQAPLAPPEALVMFIALGFGLVALVVDDLLSRPVPGAAVGCGILYAGGLAAASLIVGVTPDPLAVAVTAAGWLGVIVSRGGVPTPARGVLAAGIGAVAVVAALLTPSLAAPGLEPTVTSWGRPPADVFGRGINPMLRLGENLRRGESVEVARSITTADDPPYLKVATLIDVDGETWRQVGDGAGLPTEEPLGDIGPDIPTSTEEIRVEIGDLDTTMLPVPYRFDELRGLAGAWARHPVGGTVRSRGDTTRDLTYAASYVEIEPDAEQMRGRSTSMTPGVFRRYTELPAGTPAEIGGVAREQTAGLTNSYDRIVALQDWLRGSFSYSESAPVAEGYDGNGLDVVARFLTEEQSGYCVHFASALAAMARSLNIPARIAVGYAPGRPAGRTADGDQVYSTRSDMLHAWTEVWFDGVGWVTFDATPGVGSPTEFDEPRIEPGTTAPDVNVPDGPTAAPTAGPDSARPDADQTTEQGTGRQSVGGLGVALAVLLGALGLAPALVRQVRRLMRWRRTRVEPWWRELTDTATDLGISVPPNATARGQAEALAPAAGPEVREVVALLERELYAASAPGVDEQSRRTARSAERRLRASCTRRHRLAARVFPRSLWR
ncbi:transglutaminaseTgpA domain-containing protein [Aeromicrobium piscarium]|uniref:Transglutaminase domain-containing protein n=1 Tax=Aeromicrobium piscarium TaxID=2590901 RepID=A0A554S7S8_9ACTN|nr:DUF3488 and transglutaminase-like domain-containing protein [Aeromicrobium piscarium]TSD62403.1 transglutaminase domain-containing protein [Aeromicrobium piscarium]